MEKFIGLADFREWNRKRERTNRQILLRLDVHGSDRIARTLQMDIHG